MASMSFDLYTCKICLENMLDNNPRLLSCLHSFCSECLKKLIKESTILCPTCREQTTIQNNDITSLKVNFMIQEFRSHLDQIQSNKHLFCQFCLAETAVLKCQECIQLLCEDCSHKHDKMKTFKDHKLYKLCQKHREGMITHLCMKCAKLACSKCVMTEHFDHETEIETYEEGINKIGLNITKYECDINTAVKSLNNRQSQDTEKLKMVTKGISKVNNIKRFYLEKLQQVDQILGLLQENKAEGEKANNAYAEKVEELCKFTRLLECRSSEFRKGYLENYITLKNKLQKLLDEVKQDIWQFDPSELTIFEPHKGQEICLNDLGNIDVLLDNPVLVKSVSCPEGQDWGEPWNISNVDDECVLIAHWDKEYITCVYRSDKPMITIPAECGDVIDACVYGSHLYTAYENSISQRTFNNGKVGPEIKYNPMIKDIYSIAILNDSCFFLLSYSEQRIVKYNPNNNHMEDVVTNLEEIDKVSIMRREDDVIYVVSCRLSDKMYVYNEDWNLLYTFGGQDSSDEQFDWPSGTAYTTEGILVAEQINDRISLFSFDGKFIKHVIHCEDPPMALTFNSPYLWVTLESDPRCVKCYKLCEGELLYISS